MKWLLTTPVDVDLDGVRKEVEAAGGKLAPNAPIPLDRGEQVVYAEGPEDLHHLLKESELAIRVSPDSELKLY